MSASAELEEYDACTEREHELEAELVRVKRRIAELHPVVDEESRKRARATSDEKIKGLEALPAEILCIICREMDFADVERLRRASRALHERISHDDVWEPVYGKVPEQRLPVFKYRVAVCDKNCDGKKIFGNKFTTLYNGNFTEKISVGLPESLKKKLITATLERHGGVLFVHINSPFMKRYFDMQPELLRKGIIAIPYDCSKIISSKFIFIPRARNDDFKSIEGLLFNIESGETQSFVIRNPMSEKDWYHISKDLGEQVVVKQYVDSNYNGFGWAFNYFLLDFTVRDDTNCVFIKQTND